jgi:transcriptional regulator with XRE-family HTH domain
MNSAEIGAFLREKRKQKGLSIQQLTDLCRFASKGHIARIESGKFDFQYKTLKKICDALGLKIELK